MVQGLRAVYLTRRIPLRGKTVLVTAAAGGVGSLLVQLAKRDEARTVIAAASSEEKRALARSLDADVAVDSTAPRWFEQVKELTGGAGADVVYEATGGSGMKGCLEALAPLGEIIVYGSLSLETFAGLAFEFGVPELLPMIFKNQRLSGFALYSLLTPDTLRSNLTHLLDLVAKRSLRVHIGGTFPFARVGEAHAALEKRGRSGKLVLVP